MTVKGQIVSAVLVVLLFMAVSAVVETIARNGTLFFVVVLTLALAAVAAGLRVIFTDAEARQ